MKNMSKLRFIVQLLFVGLTVGGLLTDFRWLSAILLGSAVLGGAFVCGWVCPFGTFQDIFSKLGNLIGIKKRKMPKVLQTLLVPMRYILLVMVSLITLDFIFQVISYDPRANFLMMLEGNGVGFVAVGVMVVFGLISLVFERPFCNYLCIEGAKYGALSSLRPLTIKRDDEKCVNCKKCDRVCPMNIQVSKKDQVTSPQCINCFNCIGACPIEDTMSYGMRKYPKNLLKKSLVGGSLLVVVLAGSFATGLISDEDLGFLKEGHHGREDSKATNQEVAGGTQTSAGENSTDALGVGSSVEGYKDGTFTGSGQGFKGSMSVQVTILDGTITKVEVTEHRDDRKWFNRANDVIPDKVVETQSANVDVVGGATYSSRGIIEGVKDALVQAKL